MEEHDIERLARCIARENREAEPQITKAFWFPDTTEIRIVEVDPTVPPSGERVTPYFFRADPARNLPVPSGIALIRPSEVREIELPDGWGTWKDAVELEFDK